MSTSGWVRQAALPTCDLVVVGAGIAGLTAALCAADAGLAVVVLNKGPRWSADRREQSTSTFYAQGGVAVVLPDSPEHDSVERHLADTLAAGGGLTDPIASRSILADGWPAVDTLMRWGAEFDRDADGTLLRTREGGHTLRRIIHAGGDATGAAIQRALGAAVTAHPSIRIFDDTAATEVIVDGGRAVGVRYLGPAGRGAVGAPSVLLATGGAGQLYAATTNPAGSTGDGIALALRAGATVADLEFIQFHPTMLYTPGRRGRRTLISEAVRGEGGRLVDVDGRSVTAGVHPMGDLAPRDVVANAVEAAIEDTRHPCVYLDVEDVPDFEVRFPTVSAGVRAAGIDLAGRRIPVVPGAHYLCGGVATDDTGQTAVDGLLAAGEVARTGLHGANRLASNSLLEGLVMGRRTAAIAVARRGLSVPSAVSAEPSYPVPVLDRRLLQDTMSRRVALRRSAGGLDAAAAVLADAPLRRVESPAEVEDAALTLTASAVIAAAAARTESRGSHVRTDADPGAEPGARSHLFRMVGDALIEVVGVVEVELAGAVDPACGRGVTGYIDAR